MGQGSNNKQKTKTKPLAWQADALKDTFGQAKTTYQNSATPNADMNSAWNMTRNASTDQNSGYNQSRNYYNDVLKNGGYNDAVFNNMASPIIANVTSQFMGSGRTGGGLEGIDLTKELTNAYAPWAAQQTNMAAQNLPQLEGQQANAMYNIGNQQYQYPWQNLNNYYGIVGGNNWGGTTTSKTPAQSTLAQIGGAGLGLLGSGISGGMFNPTASIY